MSKNYYIDNSYFERLIINFQKTKKDCVKYNLFLADYQGSIERLASRNKKPRYSTIVTICKNNNKRCENLKASLANEFYKLAENLAHYGNFHYLDIDDAIQEGVMICFEKIDKFDPRKGKAFNYMTTCVFNHYKQLYRSARNYNELKKRFHEFLMQNQENKRVKKKNKDKKYNIQD